jgi:hypothetical protein
VLTLEQRVVLASKPVAINGQTFPVDESSAWIHARAQEILERAGVLRPTAEQYLAAAMTAQCEQEVRG